MLGTLPKVTLCQQVAQQRGSQIEGQLGCITFPSSEEANVAFFYTTLLEPKPPFCFH